MTLLVPVNAWVVMIVAPFRSVKLADDDWPTLTFSVPALTMAVPVQVSAVVAKVNALLPFLMNPFVPPRAELIVAKALPPRLTLITGALVTLSSVSVLRPVAIDHDP